MSSKEVHLQMIQGVVDRMARNSFLLKGWAVVLVSAMFALAARDANVAFVYLAYFPCIVFWGLDGYYLWQERLFRALYDHVRGREENDIDYSMDVKQGDTTDVTWLGAVISKTLFAFHGVVLASIILVMFISLRVSS